MSLFISSGLLFLLCLLLVEDCRTAVVVCLVRGANLEQRAMNERAGCFLNDRMNHSKTSSRDRLDCWVYLTAFPRRPFPSAQNNGTTEIPRDPTSVERHRARVEITLALAGRRDRFADLFCVCERDADWSEAILSCRAGGSRRTPLHCREFQSRDTEVSGQWSDDAEMHLFFLFVFFQKGKDCLHVTSRDNSHLLWGFCSSVFLCGLTMTPPSSLRWQWRCKKNACGFKWPIHLPVIIV